MRTDGSPGGDMKLWVFASTSLVNIQTGVDARMWAIPEPNPTVAKSIRTKARDMVVGSCGVLWCSATKTLTTPFVTSSPPDASRAVTDVWPGTWFYPFSIEPLGSPRRHMDRDVILNSLAIAAQGRSKNLSHILHLAQPQVFSPPTIPEEDWSTILRFLSD